MARCSLSAVSGAVLICNGTAIPLVIAAASGFALVKPVERWGAISSSRARPVTAAPIKTTLSPSRRICRAGVSGSAMATCRHCRQAIRWEHRNGKNHALDTDGGNHWAHCLGRRKKKERKLEMRAGPRVRGRNYVTSCGRCDVPPWEPCACSSLLPADSIAESVNAEAYARLELALES